MRRWLRENANSTVAGVLASAIFALLVWFVGSVSPTLQKMIGTTSMRDVFIVFVMALLAIYVITEMRDRDRRRQRERMEESSRNRQPTPDEVRTILNGVLQRGPLAVRVMPVPNGAYWQLSVTDANKLTSSVTYDRSGQIVISAGVGIAAAEMKRFQEMIDEPDSTFLDDLQMELAKMGAQFQVEPPFQVVVLDTLTVDEALVPTKFMDSLSLVRRAAILVITFARRSARARRRL